MKSISTISPAVTENTERLIAKVRASFHIICYLFTVSLSNSKIQKTGALTV